MVLTKELNELLLVVHKDQGTDLEKSEIKNNRFHYWDIYGNYEVYTLEVFESDCKEYIKRVGNGRIFMISGFDESYFAKVSFGLSLGGSEKTFRYQSESECIFRATIHTINHLKGLNETN